MMNLFFPLIAVLIWGINTVISKAASGVIDPAAISFYRWLLAGIILTPFCANSVWKKRAIIYRNWFKLLLLGFLGMVIFQCLAYYAASYTSATNMAVINALVPLTSLIIGILFFHAPWRLKTLFSIFLSFIGVLIILGKGNILSLFNEGINHGDGLMLIAVVSYSLYGVLIRCWSIELEGWDYLYIQIIVAILLLFPVALQANSLEISPKAAGFVLFAGIGSSLIAAFCWMQGLQRVGVEQTSIFMNLVPLFTSIIAINALHEHIGFYHIIGGGMIIIGVLLTQINRQLIQKLRHHTSIG